MNKILLKKLRYHETNIVNQNSKLCYSVEDFQQTLGYNLPYILYVCK